MGRKSKGADLTSPPALPSGGESANHATHPNAVPPQPAEGAKTAIAGRRKRPIWKTLDEMEVDRKRELPLARTRSISHVSIDVPGEASDTENPASSIVVQVDVTSMEHEHEQRYVALATAGRRFFRRQDYHQALPYFRASLQFAKDIPAKRVLPTYRYMGKCFMATKQVKHAIHAHRRELALAADLQDIALTGRAYGNIGHALRAARGFNQAIQSFQKQHDICKMSKDREGRIAALENLGRSYQEVATAWAGKKDAALAKEYYTQALIMYKKCLKLAGQARNKRMVGRAYGGLGVVYEQMEDFPNAIQAYKKRLAFAQHVQDDAAQGRALCNMGNAYRAMEKPEKALECYQQDLQISEGQGDPIGIAVTCR